MRFDEIDALVGDVPFIQRDNAKYLYDLIVNERLTNLLELGIGHGTATCYMAAALDQQGQGKVTGVDLVDARDVFSPSAEEQLDTVKLARYAEIVRMQTGYNWFLHDRIRERTLKGQCRPVYDLCYIDGPKNWTIDGAAFFFVDKLLLEGGWIVFDDVDWTYARADERRDATDGITHRALSRAERETPHVREIFELLVAQHPAYSNLQIPENLDWAVAQKTSSPETTVTSVRRPEFSWKAAFLSKLRRLWPGSDRSSRS